MLLGRLERISIVFVKNNKKNQISENLKIRHFRNLTEISKKYFWDFGIFENLNISISKKNILKKFFFNVFLFFIKMMLIRSSLPSSNPVTLLGTIVLLSETDPNVGKSRKSSKMDFSLVLSMYQCTKRYQWANGNKIMICPLFLVKYFPEGLGVVPGVFPGLY